ncbi:uncharacterized protein LOC135463209 [Liolophura sinensis]|uniref:uncharacterized protein LOC135463209 n=1 Tax=Liolophura sinensis TaxID=3198878 RepID=UPI00315958BA
MDKRIVALLGLLALTVCAVAQDPETPDDDLEEESGRLDVIRNLIGDVSSFPDWFQQIIAKKLAAIEERLANRPEGGRRGPPRRRGRHSRLFVPTEEELEGIEVPEWFTKVIEQLKKKKKGGRHPRPPTEPREPREPIEFGDDVPEWFKTYFEEFQARRKALRESRHDQRPEGGDGSGRRGPKRGGGPPRRRGGRPEA